jgi:predicted small secreted protein
MQEAQRRQLVVGSVIAVTVGVVLYHVLFKKPNSQNSNANGKAESKQGMKSYKTNVHLRVV